MPLKLETLPSVTPRKIPKAVRTVGHLLSVCWALNEQAMNNTNPLTNFLMMVPVYFISIFVEAHISI